MKKKTGLIRLLVILAVIALLAGARAVRLPWAGETLAGGGTVHVQAPIDRIPVFERI